MEDTKFTEKSHIVIDESITKTAKPRMNAHFHHCANLSMWEEGYSNHRVCVLPLYLIDYKVLLSR